METSTKRRVRLVIGAAASRVVLGTAPRLATSSLAAVALAAIGFAAPIVAKADQSFALANLCSGANASAAQGVNDRGEVVGYNHQGGVQVDDEHAFAWTLAGGMIDLALPGGHMSVAAGVNDSGEVVGGSETAGGSWHAFAYTAGQGMTDLGVASGDSASTADAVNESGEIVGSVLGHGHDHAMVYTPSGGMVDIGTLPGDAESLAGGVNDHGEVVGESFNYDSGPSELISWTPSGGLVDLGPLPDVNARVTGVNDSGEIVGYSRFSPASSEHAFVYTPSGGIVDLGTLPGGGTSYAQAVNDSGEIVGWGNSSQGIRAFMYTPGDGMVDIGGLAGTGVTQAFAVSDNGYIAGDSGETTSYAAVLWQPSGLAVTAMPQCITTIVGLSQTRVLDTFTVSDQQAGAADYSALIDWGDGQMSAGQISGMKGSFEVRGSHAYAKEGSYKVKTTITDTRGTGRPVTIASTAAAVRPLLTVSGVRLNSTQSLKGIVAKFADYDPGLASDYRATVDWGDGTPPTRGTITRIPTAPGVFPGRFTVRGAHQYAATGRYTITVQVSGGYGGYGGATSHVLAYALAAANGASFVIGSGHTAIGGDVLFWGLSWRRHNMVAWIPARSGFTGFAETPSSNPPACGGAWRTGPGNNTPPTTLPQYLGVFVSRAISKHGRQFSGKISHIVVVKPSPGYRGNSRGSGVGTVIATVC